MKFVIKHILLVTFLCFAFREVRAAEQIPSGHACYWPVINHVIQKYAGSNNLFHSFSITTMDQSDQLHAFAQADFINQPEMWPGYYYFELKIQMISGACRVQSSRLTQVHM